jgi:CheY-like chemotaxis protein
MTELAGEAPQVPVSKPSVLLVDDDEFCRWAVSSKLTLLGAEVHEARDGAEAYDKLCNRPFNLAIIDLDMPVMDGFDLIACIRGTPGIRHMPAVVLTLNDEREMIEKALVAGATSFLVKPLNWAVFGAHIEHLLRLTDRYSAPALV